MMRFLQCEYIATPNVASSLIQNQLAAGISQYPLLVGEDGKYGLPDHSDRTPFPRKVNFLDADDMHEEVDELNELNPSQLSRVPVHQDPSTPSQLIAQGQPLDPADASTEASPAERLPSSEGPVSDGGFEDLEGEALIAHLRTALIETRRRAQIADSKALTDRQAAHEVYESRIARASAAAIEALESSQPRSSLTSRSQLATPRTSGLSTPFMREGTSAYQPLGPLSAPGTSVASRYGFADEEVTSTLWSGLLTNFPLYLDSEFNCMESDNDRKCRLALWEYFEAGFKNFKYLIKNLPKGDIRGLLEIVLRHGKRALAELSHTSDRKLKNLKKTGAFGPYLASLDERVADFESYGRKLSDSELITQLRFGVEDSPKYVEEIRSLVRLDKNISFANLRSELSIFATSIRDMDDHYRHSRHAVHVVDYIEACRKWAQGECTRIDCPYTHLEQARGTADSSSRRKPPHGRAPNVNSRRGRAAAGNRASAHYTSPRGGARGGNSRAPRQPTRDGGRQAHFEDEGKYEHLPSDRGICFRFEQDGKCDYPQCKFRHVDAKGAQLNYAGARPHYTDDDRRGNRR